MVKDIGLSISMDQLIAGLTTQLQSGDSLLDGEEMARRYATMQASIGKGLNALIEKVTRSWTRKWRSVKR